MSALTFELRERRDRVGLKGPRAAEWLVAQGFDLPMSPNTWTYAGRTPGQPRASTARAGESAAQPGTSSSSTGSVLVARLGSSEFFLVDDTGAVGLDRLAPDLDRPQPGVYPVLREDVEFALAGDALAGDPVHDVLAQVCNVNFAALSLEARPVIMTLMIGVAVLVVPQSTVHGRCYRIWCDPTFGAYIGESLGRVVVDCGGSSTGVMA